MRLAIAGAGHLPARSNVTRLLASNTRCAPLAAAIIFALAPMAVAVAQRTPQPSLATASPTSARSCLDTAATIAPARLDERHLIYVEQETVVANRDGRVLVAGAPVFVWRNVGDRYDALALDSLFGMIVEPASDVVRGIPSPLPGRDLKGMRAVALPDGWWLVTFAEVFSVQNPKRPNVIAMWAGETNGSSWRALAKLPAVIDTLDALRFSQLAMRGQRVRLAASVRRDWRRRVVLFSRDNGRWTARADDFGLADAIAVASTASSDLLAAVRPDTTLREDDNSLFLYTKAPTDTLWTAHPRLWRGGTNPVHEPRFADDAGKPLLLWVTGPMFHANSAWALSVGTPDSMAAPIAMPTTASTMVVSSLGDAGIIATFDRGSPTGDLRLFEYHEPLTVSLVLSKATAYRGLMGVALTSGRAVLVASKPATPPRDPAVISMIETYTWRCTTADARSP